MNHVCKEFQVNLVNDPGCRRNSTVVVKCFLCPAKELITLGITFKFKNHICFQGIRCTVLINLH
ncbi:Uncharacterised protein [Mycobacteroides abscessus subsp. abscessus]|nr:Uncharacterised protein [Mycobacteroides abscessus subsp. abscessus]